MDDDPAQRLLVSNVLSQAEFDVSAAEDGATGLSVMQVEQPDLVLLDVVMPGMSGFEVCETIRGSAEIAHIPIVIVTACDDHEAIQTAYDAGATHFLTKPLNWDLLGHQVRYVLRNSRLEADLRLAKDRADKANEAKSQFVRNMSHELRSPLHAIIGLAELLGSDAISGEPDQVELFRSQIHDSGKHLLAIVNDLLQLSQVEAGKHSLHEEVVDLQTVFSNPLQIVCTLAKSKNIQCRSSIRARGRHVWADPRALQQIAINLLSNAVKFTDEGGSVAFDVSVADEGPVSIKISDTGIGMSEEEAERAFRPFEQINSSLSRAHDGTGLGLPLAASLVELHGGTLEITSSPGNGAVATVTLPATRLIEKPSDFAAE